MFKRGNVCLANVNELFAAWHMSETSHDKKLEFFNELICAKYIIKEKLQGKMSKR